MSISMLPSRGLRLTLVLSNSIFASGPPVSLVCGTSAFPFPPSFRFRGAQQHLFGVYMVWEKLHVPEDKLVCSRAAVIAVAKATSKPSRFARYIPPIDVTVKTQSPPLHDC